MLRSKFLVYFLGGPNISRGRIQMMTVCLAVVLALFPCLSDATWCDVYSKRDHQGCWKWILDNTSTSNCTTLGIKGVSTGVIACTDTYHKRPLAFLFSQSIPKVCPYASPGTSAKSRSIEAATFTSDGSTTDGEPTSTASFRPTTVRSEAYSSTRSPGVSPTTRPTNAKTSTLIKSTTVEDEATSTAIPTTAYSEEQPKCPSPLEYDTDTSYYYRYLEIPTGTKGIEFEVKANNDVHIALSPSLSSSDLYETVIGGWGNTKSVIRRCKQCANKVITATYQYLSTNEFRKFWITFGSDGAIAVGKDDESTPFMEWTDPDPLNIQYLGYSTGWGSSGEFQFCNLG